MKTKSKPPVIPPVVKEQLEPWLRGVLPDIDPVIGHLLRASEHIQEDAEAALDGLTVEQLQAKPHGLTSAGFHAKHLAGSTGRLCTYLEGAQLTEEQVSAILQEGAVSQTAPELLAEILAAFTRYESLLHQLRPESFGSLRGVGRRRIAVTAVSLAIHIAEHGQRHTGQLLSAARLAKKQSDPDDSSGT